MHEYKPSMILVVKMMMVVSVMVVSEEKKSSIWGNPTVFIYKTFLIFVNQCVFRCLDGYEMCKMGIQNKDMKQIDLKCVKQKIF